MKSNDAQMTISIDNMPEEYRGMAQVIGLEKALALAKKMGGHRIYIPKFESLVRQIKYRAVQREFNGRNYSKLAQKYGYTPRWIRHIVDQGSRPDQRSAE